LIGTLFVCVSRRRLGRSGGDGVDHWNGGKGDDGLEGGAGKDGLMGGGGGDNDV